MSFNLASLVAPTRRPLIATLVGDGGMGKTTLGAMFPDPVFFRFEDGTQSISSRTDVALFPVATHTREFKEAIESLRKEPHGFKTLVVDSITRADDMLQEELVKEDSKATSLATVGGGYGAGYQILNAKHREIRELCGKLSAERGMNIIFLAHATTETVSSPDSAEYMRGTIRMHKNSVANYSDNVDLVAFIKLKTFLTGDDKAKRAVGTGERVISCYPTPSHISKNRFGITKDIPFTLEGGNPFASLLED